MPVLSESEIARRVSALSGWERSGPALRKVCRFEDFRLAMTFVNRVAGEAEGLGHHPDILIEYNKVTLTLSSHDAGGLTERDFDLAERIDA